MAYQVTRGTVKTLCHVYICGAVKVAWRARTRSSGATSAGFAYTPTTTQTQLPEGMSDGEEGRERDGSEQDAQQDELPPDGVGGRGEVGPVVLSPVEPSSPPPTSPARSHPRNSHLAR
jgi:hypothetical protein